MDMNRFRLRTMLDDLAAVGDLDTHSGATPLAKVARLLQDSDKAVLFEQGGAEGQALVGNVMSSRRRLAQAFGVEPRDLLKEIRKRLANRPEVVEVPRAQAPVQEVVMQGDEVDLFQLPLHVQHG